MVPLQGVNPLPELRGARFLATSDYPCNGLQRPRQTRFKRHACGHHRDRSLRFESRQSDTLDIQGDSGGRLPKVGLTFIPMLYCLLDSARAAGNLAAWKLA